MITIAESTSPAKPGTFAGHVHDALEAKDTAAPLALRKVANLVLVRRLRALIGRRQPGSSALWSINKLATALGANSAYVSSYVNQVDAAGKPAANPPALTMALQAWEDGVEQFLIGLEERRTMSDDLFPTAISRQFQRFARQVIAAKQWGVFFGPGGDGKTCAMRAYHKANPLAIMVTVYQWCSGANPLAAAIFAAVNRSGAWRNTQPRTTWLVEKLTGADRPLLIDNFHQLSMGALTFLGNLHDATGIPIICAGNPSGLAKARQDEQLYTRIKQAEAATFGAGRTKTSALNEAAQALLLRDAPDYIADLIPLAVQVLGQRGTMRALQARVALMNEMLGRMEESQRDPAAAFRAAHAALINDGETLE